MADRPRDLSKARILVTNDDGIRARGIQPLINIARSLSDDIWVVAPENEQSATSNSLTLRRALRIHDYGEKRFAVDGTPTDCVLIAVQEIATDRPFDLVLSGVNNGVNLGEDVAYSGTIAAAIQGTMLNCRSVALSQLREPDGMIDPSISEQHAPDILRKLYGLDWPAEVLFNINFPAGGPGAVKGIRTCRQGRRDTEIVISKVADPKGRDHVWIGDYSTDATSQADSDLAAIADQMISVTPLQLDRTHDATLAQLEEVFA